jgi:hypothetical protein
MRIVFTPSLKARVVGETICQEFAEPGSVQKSCRKASVGWMFVKVTQVTRISASRSVQEMRICSGITDQKFLPGQPSFTGQLKPEEIVLRLSVGEKPRGRTEDVG